MYLRTGYVGLAFAAIRRFGGSDWSDHRAKYIFRRATRRFRHTEVHNSLLAMAGLEVSIVNHDYYKQSVPFYTNQQNAMPTLAFPLARLYVY